MYVYILLNDWPFVREWLDDFCAAHPSVPCDFGSSYKNCGYIVGGVEGGGRLISRCGGVSGEWWWYVGMCWCGGMCQEESGELCRKRPVWWRTMDITYGRALDQAGRNTNCTGHPFFSFCTAPSAHVTSQLFLFPYPPLPSPPPTPPSVTISTPTLPRGVVAERLYYV